jgi:N-acetyl-gamma-glutamyl-phosphate reductase common form
MNKIKVAIVGARGYVGFELLQLLDNHPLTEVVAAFSREFDGKAVHKVVAGFSDTQLHYRSDELTILNDMDLDVIFLALPNGLAAQQKILWQNLSQTTCIIDLSSDFRFDTSWVYGQPETCEKHIISQSLIANPGCYATAAQLGLLPMINHIVGSPSIFGVSGYSGAGSKANDNNNPVRLSHNIKAYKLIDHIHEQEISHVLSTPVHFMPHVTEFFRGIHLTISLQLDVDFSLKEINTIYKQFYQAHELIEVSSEIPEVQQVQNTHKVLIGGCSIKAKHMVLCVCIDNLLKGAATQAIQNMNLALSQKYNLTINSGIPL